jgi:hypothetical protein
MSSFSDFRKVVSIEHLAPIPRLPVQYRGRAGAALGAPLRFLLLYGSTHTLGHSRILNCIGPQWTDGRPKVEWKITPPTSIHHDDDPNPFRSSTTITILLLVIM